MELEALGDAMKVENPSKSPVLVCRVATCDAYAFVRAREMPASGLGLAKGDPLPPGWQHDPIKGFICPKHAKNGSGKHKRVVETTTTTQPRTFNTTGDTCTHCGSIDLVPAGRCMKCMNCGESTGCG